MKRIVVIEDNTKILALLNENDEVLKTSQNLDELLEACPEAVPSPEALEYARTNKLEQGRVVPPVEEVLERTHQEVTASPPNTHETAEAPKVKVEVNHVEGGIETVTVSLLILDHDSYDIGEIVIIIIQGTLKQILAQPYSYILYQGDCRKILPLLKDQTIDLCVTSPPYWHVMKYTDTQLEGEIGVRDTLEGYTRSLLKVFMEIHRVLKPNGSFYLNLDNGKRQAALLPITGYDFLPYLRRIGFKLIQVISWVDRDRRPLYSKRFLDHHYESIFLLAKGENYTFNRDQTRFQGDVWEIVHHRYEDYDKGDIWDGSNPGDWILDPFCGSGTTLDVAQRLGRNAVGIEINFQSFQTIMRRVFNKNSKNRYKFITWGQLQREKLKRKNEL